MEGNAHPPKSPVPDPLHCKSPAGLPLPAPWRDKKENRKGSRKPPRLLLLVFLCPGPRRPKAKPERGSHAQEGHDSSKGPQYKPDGQRAKGRGRDGPPVPSSGICTLRERSLARGSPGHAEDVPWRQGSLQLRFVLQSGKPSERRWAVFRGGCLQPLKNQNPNCPLEKQPDQSGHGEPPGPAVTAPAPLWGRWGSASGPAALPHRAQLCRAVSASGSRLSLSARL